MSDPEQAKAIHNLLVSISSQPGETAKYAQKYLKFLENGTWKISDLPKYFSVNELSMYLKGD